MPAKTKQSKPVAATSNVADTSTPAMPRGVTSGEVGEAFERMGISATAEVHEKVAFYACMRGDDVFVGLLTAIARGVVVVRQTIPGGRLIVADR